MEKMNAVLVLLNSGKLEETLKNFNLDNINLVAVAADDTAETFFRVNERQIPTVNFSAVHKLAKNYKDCFWLIGGAEGVAADRMKKFLMSFDVSADKIINAEFFGQISETWLANLNYIEEHGADFFATGNEYMRDGLNLNYIPCVRKDKTASSGGVNLADAFQDLRQSYLTARYVFAHVKPGTIKFVLIGLSPYSFRYDNSKDFANPKNLQYRLALQDFAEEELCLENFLGDDVKDIFAMTTAAQADLNFDAMKENLRRGFSIKAVTDWKDDSEYLTVDDEEKNIQILKDYMELCLANGAKPVGIVFPYAPAMRNNFDRELLTAFRETIQQLESNSDFVCIDLFDRFKYNCFCDMTHLNLKGTLIVNSLLSFRLYKRNLIPVENFCDMSCDWFYQLSWIITKNEYNALMKRVFNIAAQRVAGKKKIKVGFVLYDSSTWCGNDLYNFFARDERFEPTVFLCLRVDGYKENQFIRKELLSQTEQFKSTGLNTVALDSNNATVPEQDLLIYLIPYANRLPEVFHLANIAVKTLTAYISYGCDVGGKYDSSFTPIVRVAWKQFFPTRFSLEMYNRKSAPGTPQRIYSGYPKLDAFRKNAAELKFDWKMTRPDAKKIIWAPHHSIKYWSIQTATFHWNYQFMYEFAKAHPEISWVVKPHSNLPVNAIRADVFPSAEAFEEYLQKWNELPNAQVCTGAYYQAIFATSDGMIHDCGSFTAEYQYVDKPMIYLMRKGAQFNELGNEILKASYPVDGKDFDAIAAMIQRVFIEGDDFKAQERKAVFDKYLNYRKDNGMSASEFIYKNIADTLKAPKI